MRKKLGLALGSGGVRGVAHVGFLMALEEAGIRADCVTGCSMGAIVGLCYCSGMKVSDMKDIILKLKLSSIASLNVAPLRANGLMRLNKARALLSGYFGEKNFDELDIPFQCVATDVVSGRLIVLKEGNAIDAAIASGCIPGVFTPQPWGEYRLVDGGILERVPTPELKKMGADVVVAVDVLGNLMQKNVDDNLIGTLLRCIDIVDTRQTQAKHRARKKQVDLWIEPALGAMDQYKVRKKSIAEAYNIGYDTGKENVEKIRALIGE